jgi:hypothetical protein
VCRWRSIAISESLPNDVSHKYTCLVGFFSNRASMHTSKYILVRFHAEASGGSRLMVEFAKLSITSFMSISVV